MTNFEYIKNMSEKELAQFLMHIRIDSFGAKEIEGELLFTDNDFYMWVEKERIVSLFVTKEKTLRWEAVE